MNTDPVTLRREYESFRALNVHLDMSRGRPSAAQLDLSVPMLDMRSGFVCEDGMDARNYGDTAGIPEIRRLFGELLGMPPEQVIAGGNSSINMLHDALTRALLNGPLEGDVPWSRLRRVRMLCPVPGYDWHFHMCDTLGIETVPVPLGEEGPDMDSVRELVKDPAVKGIVCVPMYSNPTGITYSDEVVEALAAMETAAPDFRIFWDNAYCVHHLYPDRRDRLANLYDNCVKHGVPDRPLLFTSTSKITFAGGGVAAMAASPANIRRQLSLLTYQLVCYDKVNQLRHARFLPDLAAVEKHMAKQAEIVRPKFELVLDTLEKTLSGIARWSRPLGGYFVCLWAPPGCAARTVELCRNAGVTLTPAGAPFPGGHDPEDSVIRIAPTMPPMEELRLAMRLLPVAVKLAASEKGLL